MEGLVNAYDGPGFVGAGVGTPKRRDGVKLSHRDLMNRFVIIGNEQLNLNDYNRTAHLPIGRGRLACDPDTGEFDKDTPRAAFNPVTAPLYPRHVHSTITPKEYKEVKTHEEYLELLSTKKWAAMPLPIKKAYVLSNEDQLTSMKGQLEAERARNNMLENRMEEFLAGANNGNTDAAENQSLHARQIAELQEQNELLTSRMTRMLELMEAKQAEVPADVEVKSDDKKRK